MKAPPQFNTTVMAKEILSNYSVSKETALLLDGIKHLDKTWELVKNCYTIKNGEENEEIIIGSMGQFVDAFNHVKGIVLDMINDNVIDNIGMADFKEI